MFACECTPQADGGRVSGRAASQQIVDRKHGGDGRQSPDTIAQDRGVCQGARGGRPQKRGCQGGGKQGRRKQRAERSGKAGDGVRG